MPIYRKPEDRASETVTIRLTLKERHMLDHLAAIGDQTLTDFIRGLIANRAKALNIEEAPAPPRKRGPGRPKKKRPIIVESERPSIPPPVPVPRPPAVVEVEVETPAFVPEVEERLPTSSTFDGLVKKFRENFSHRAEGTRRELEETIAFLFSTKDGEPVIDPTLSLDDLTLAKLEEIRERIRQSKNRLAKKNLHLTYLRMMIHFATKDPDIELKTNPTGALQPFTLTEAPDSWRFFTGH